MTQKQEALLKNHLAFLASHRGQVRRGANAIFVDSDRAEFTYAILGETTSLDDLGGATTVQHFPWNSLNAPQLESAGFSPMVGFSYMTLSDQSADWRTFRDLSIVAVEKPDQLDIFSEVQSRGFMETEEAFKVWHPWLSRANSRNLKNPDQIFYLAYSSGQPVATALTIFNGETAGIYAVATLAEFRKRGISTTLLSRAVQDARDRKARIITLQVKQDSYVEDFYRHLGFQRHFVGTFFVQKPKTGG